MKLTACAIALSLALSLSACGSSDPAIPCAEVEDAAAVADTIAEGANGTPIAPTGKLGAVKSPEMTDAYLVALEFTAPGVDDAEVGVWALTTLDGSGPVLAVDGFAAEFTDWPNQINGHKFNVTEPGTDDAKTCLS